MNAHTVITRWRVARSPLATGPGAAWNWRYDVTRSDGSTVCAGLERLTTARRRAGETGEPVRLAWVLAAGSASP